MATGIADKGLHGSGLYPVVDSISSMELVLLGFDAKSMDLDSRTTLRRGGMRHGKQEIAAKPTGEKRCPKAGEWYLSGASVAAYRAPNDFPSEYHIAKLVRIVTKTTVVVEES